MLKKLDIDNYKSLSKVRIALPNFCALVGANAAGKSNLADAIEFLSIVARLGLPAAVTDKGGYENICFKRSRRARGPIRFSISLDNVMANISKQSGIEGYELGFDYSFAFRATKRAIRSEFVVESEELSARIRPANAEAPWKETLSWKYSRPHYKLKMRKPTPRERLSFFRLPRQYLEAMLKEWVRGETHSSDLFLTARLRGMPPFLFLMEELSRFRMFQLSPGKLREPTSASGIQEMGKDGSNLPMALDLLGREEPGAFTELLE